MKHWNSIDSIDMEVEISYVIERENTPQTFYVVSWVMCPLFKEIVTVIFFL